VAGVLWQNLDPKRFAEATKVPVLPIVIEQTAPLDSRDDLVRAWPAPDVGHEKHRIYMLQWYSFAALTAFLWLFFTFRRKR
jgi:cytochrome oxidase assembly protein ShyY1